jgi:D-lactate dehydrogenase
MKLVFFSAQPYDKSFFTQFNQNKHELVFIDFPLSEQTAELAAGADAVCVFVNDKVTAGVIQKLATGKTKIIALRCAGLIM